MKALFLAFLPILLTACATKRASVVHMTPRSVPGTTLPSEGVESVRYAETIKAYPIGRYVDPGNRRIMHERHTIYRVETTPKWNLHPNAPVSVPMGPRISASDPAQNPAPVTDEIREEINRQKAISREMTTQGERLNAHLQNLRHSLDTSKTVAEQNLLLQQKLQETSSRVDQLERKLGEEPKLAPASASVDTSEVGTARW